MRTITACAVAAVAMLSGAGARSQTQQLLDGQRQQEERQKAVIAATSPPVDPYKWARDLNNLQEGAQASSHGSYMVYPKPFYPSPFSHEGWTKGSDCRYNGAPLANGDRLGTCKYSGRDGYGFAHVVWSHYKDDKGRLLERPVSAVPCHIEATEACTERLRQDAIEHKQPR